MFTETYIEMVSKADEIQGLWQDRIKNGEYRTDYVYYYDPNNKEYKVDLFLGIHEYGNKISHNLTISPTNSAYGYPGISWQKDINEFKWLPTLEDLFGIAKPIFSRTALELNYVVIGDKVEVLIGKCDSEGCGLDIEFTATSLETGLLRAIMAYEYNKSWNGKEWEEINGS